MRNRLLCALLALALLTACGGRENEKSPGPGEAALYYRRADPQEGEAVLGWEARPFSGATAGELVELLLEGPQGNELISPFPPGCTLDDWRLEDGLVTLDMGEAYGGLSGVDQTLADACVALTLCQLEEVEQIAITVRGRPRPFRDQVLDPENFLLELELEADTEGENRRGD